MTEALREGMELGGYRIEATTGSQPTGTVYRATQVATGQTVALHLVARRLARDAIFRDRFRRELGLLSELSNPYLLKIFETGEEPGADEFDPVKLWAAVAPAPGPDLATVLLHQDKLTAAQAAHLIAQAAEALEEAHGIGVLHRGLEPGSILISEDDRSAHLYGFGLVDDGAVEGGTRDIHRSAYPPSPDYVAPEQITGKVVDHRADVYGLGGVLYFALTGRPPFEGSSIEDILNGHLRGKVPVPSDAVSSVPEALDVVVARALAKNPSDRYGSAVALADDLLLNVGARPRRPRSTPQPIAASTPSAPAEPEAADEPVDAGTSAEKQRVIRAWTDAVSAGGRLWSPSAAGTSVAAAGSAAAPAPDETTPAGRGDFSQFDSARRAAQDDSHGPETDQEPKRSPQVVEPPTSSKTSSRKPSRPRRSALIGVGAAALIAAVAAGGIVLAQSGDDDSEKAAAPEKPAAEAPKKPAAENKPAQPKPRASLIPWPDRGGFTAIVYASPADRKAATSRARKAVAAGVTAGVLRSDDYRSLPPGYWVAFAGVYRSPEQAQRTADRMKREDVAAQPYVRRIAAQP